VKKGETTAFKSGNLEVWELSLDDLDDAYRVSEELPKEELSNLRSRWIRSAPSMELNIAEGSTGQTGSGQVRFLGHAIRSLVESAACYRIAQRRKFPSENERKMGDRMLMLIKKLQSFRNTVQGKANASRT
jgi:four helix bundle protein